jgi:hypothetical protein
MGTFLAKAGAILAKIVGLVSGVEPLVNAALPNSVQQKIAPVETQVTSELTDIGGVLVGVEQTAQILSATGGSVTPEQKIALAAPEIAQIIQSSALMANKKIANEASFENAITALALDFQNLLNSLESK